jgi:hypothetical protein
VLLLSAVPSHVRREPVLGCAAFDVLQQTLLQMAVPEEHRGRAVGWRIAARQGLASMIPIGVTWRACLLTVDNR